MRYWLVIVAAVVVAAVITSRREVSAKRFFDNPNYGYCHGSLRRVPDVRRCRPPGPHSGPCPPGMFTKTGRSWARDVRNCRRYGVT